MHTTPTNHPAPPPGRLSSLDTAPRFQLRWQPERGRDWPDVTSLKANRRAVRGEILREDAAG